MARIDEACLRFVDLGNRLRPAIDRACRPFAFQTGDRGWRMLAMALGINCSARDWQAACQSLSPTSADTESKATSVAVVNACMMTVEGCTRAAPGPRR